MSILPPSTTPAPPPSVLHARLLRHTPFLRTPTHHDRLIQTHTFHSLHLPSLHIFLHLLHLHLPPTPFTFPSVLKSTSALALLPFSLQLHALLLKSGFISHPHSATALLDVYCKWADFLHARKLFDGIPDRGVAAWNVMLACYAQNGRFEEALEMIEVMEREIGEVGASSWNSVIAGCVRRNDVEFALEGLRVMVRKVRPNAATFNTVLPVVPDVGCVRRVRELHGYVVRNSGVVGMSGVDEERFWSEIACAYARNGRMDYATLIFEGVKVRHSQLWNSMVAGLFGIGCDPDAFQVFREMAKRFEEEGRCLSKMSLTTVLPKCDPQSKRGLEIHAYVYRHGMEGYSSVSNALIAMYMKRGDLTSSERVFRMAREKDVVTWNTMVSSYALHLDSDMAFALFVEMLSKGVRPDEFSYGSVLDGCGQSLSLLQGMALHCQVIKGGFLQSCCAVQNAVVDMYGKCGYAAEARKLFDEMESKDIISWNTIISCYAFSANPYESFVQFRKMREAGFRANHVTFIGLLSACSHAGLLEEASRLFKSMKMEYGITPDIGHYTCIVDGLCRAGQLDEAYRLIRTMPVEADDCIWGALLGGCKIHRNIELAEVAAKHLKELEPQHSGYRVLLSNIYADAAKWGNVAQVRTAMKDDGVNKIPGYSWVEVGGEVVKFFTADTSQKHVFFTLKGLTKQLRDEGYAPTTDVKLSLLDRAG